MEKVAELVDRYIAAWNETSPEQRRKLVASTWADEGRYVDAHRAATGHEAIDLMIQNAQTQYSGYRLQLIKNVESHNDSVRFLWHAGGVSGAPVHLIGTDIGVMGPDGRFVSVTGFADVVPGSS